MAEIKVARIKSLYGEARGYFESIDKNSAVGSQYTVPRSIVDNYNIIVDETSQITGTDYSRCKIPDRELRQIMSFRVVEPLIASFIKRLELEYGFSSPNSTTQAIAIINENSNKVIQTNYTITNLISQEANVEAKEKLKQLNDELNKENKSWDNVKKILIWIINFSAELFLKVLPTILEKYH